MTTGEVEALLDRDLFSAWLSKQHPEDFVGTRACSDACPVWTYLNEMGVKRAVVSKESVYFDSQDGERVRQILPTWAMGFIADVDEGSTWIITARVALRILLGKS